MFDFENNFHKIYENHVLTALKLTKFYKASNVYNPQIIFVGKTYRFLYWFPTKIHKTYKKSKAPLIKVAVTHSSYSFFKIPDPLFFKIHLLSYYGLDASEVFSTPEFSNFIFNYNESIKQQEFKRRLP
ncbi:MAG: hypothetical protein Q8N17_12260, partial [Burkholderiaceae bacterium]|nr:hypothetical protein [Burkholderiaceae bacterium]